MLGYYLCMSVGVLIGILLASLMHASHDADIWSAVMLSKGEKKQEE